jgi:hypothetical protein
MFQTWQKQTKWLPAALNNSSAAASIVLLWQQHKQFQHLPRPAPQSRRRIVVLLIARPFHITLLSFRMSPFTSTFIFICLLIAASSIFIRLNIWILNEYTNIANVLNVAAFPYLSSVTYLNCRNQNKLLFNIRNYVFVISTPLNTYRLMFRIKQLNLRGRVSKYVTNGSKPAVMDVIGFLYVSLGSSTVELYDSVGSRRAYACSEAGFSSQNGDCAWGVLPKGNVLLWVFYFVDKMTQCKGYS